MRGAKPTNLSAGSDAAENDSMAITSSATRELAVEIHAHPRDLAGDWERLAERSGATPFAYPGWFAAWYEAFGRRTPEIVAARRNGELVAVLPLERHARGLRAAANWHSPLFAPLVADDEARDALVEALFSMRASRYDLTMVDSADPIVARLRAATRCTVERVVARQPYVDTRGMWVEYDASLSRKHRKELRRLRRRLDEHGEVEFEFTAGGERLGALLDEGFAIEGSGWKDEAGTSIASEPRIERFYRDVAHWADERGWLMLAFLRLDGRAIAFDLCLEADGVTYALKGGFAPEFRRCAPGCLLTYQSLARSFSTDGLSSYEFLGDADRYKLSWSDAVHERVRVQAFPSTPVGLAGYVAWTHGRRAAKRALAWARR
jgi:CelD/BcsL family acetyltransferase involved in cellulose biosynthesis